MASRRPRPRRFLLPTVLAAVLAAEITGIALARTMAPPVVQQVAPPAAAAVAAIPAQDVARRGSLLAADAAIEVAPPWSTGSTAAPVRVARPVAPPRAKVTQPASHRVVVRKVVVHPSTTHRATATVPKAPAPSYHGVNHVWIPSLGINKGVQSFPCSRSRPPDAGVYRWGCAGANNVYLLAHAWSTFKPLHDAYVGGRLHTGMKVVYADGAGHVHTYSVIWWRVVAPTTAASWAWAPLSRPGMTLQTCVGANSAYRLMVRLTQVA